MRRRVACLTWRVIPFYLLSFTLTLLALLTALTHLRTPSQSHVRYATPAQWEAHFLKRVFERVYTALKPGCAFLLNVAGPPPYPTP